MKPITASSTNNKHNPAPSLGGNSLPGLLTKITEQTQGSSAGWGCKALLMICLQETVQPPCKSTF